jgi:hypothetical protein
MYRELINYCSFPGLIALFVSILICISYGAAVFSAWCVKEPMDANHRDVANKLIGVLSSGFSILLAFIIINTWNDYLRASNVVTKEASHLSLIIKNSAPLAHDAPKKIHQAVANYTRVVRTNEWQTMRVGNEDPKSWDALNALFKEVNAYTPTDTKDTIYYYRTLSSLNDVLIARRDRLNAIHSIIPGTLRTSLLISSFILAIILGGVRGEKSFFNLLPVLFFAGVLGFNLAVALSFDYPFSGEVAISNAPFYKGALGAIQD